MWAPARTAAVTAAAVGQSRSAGGRPPDASARQTCDSDLRIIKGGSFKDFETRLHVSFRKSTLATEQSDEIGFRVARDLPELPAPQLLAPSCEAKRVERPASPPNATSISPRQAR